MQNTMIPQEDVAKMKEAIAKVKEYSENHKQIIPTFEGADNQLQRVHTILYLELVKDLITAARSLETILDATEEEFINIITNDGKLSIDEAERSLMTNVLLAMLTD